MKKYFTVDSLNLPKHISHHLIGKDHTSTHRKIFGVIIMGFGVLFVRIVGMLHIEIIHIIAEMIGYGIHGIGLIPFASSIEKIEEIEQQITQL